MPDGRSEKSRGMLTAWLSQSRNLPEAVNDGGQLTLTAPHFDSCSQAVPEQARLTRVLALRGGVPLLLSGGAKLEEMICAAQFHAVTSQDVLQGMPVASRSRLKRLDTKLSSRASEALDAFSSGSSRLRFQLHARAIRVAVLSFIRTPPGSGQLLPIDSTDGGCS